MLILHALHLIETERVPDLGTLATIIVNCLFSYRLLSVTHD